MTPKTAVLWNVGSSSSYSLNPGASRISEGESRLSNLVWASHRNSLLLIRKVGFPKADFPENHTEESSRLQQQAYKDLEWCIPAVVVQNHHNTHINSYYHLWEGSSRNFQDKDYKISRFWCVVLMLMILHLYLKKDKKKWILRHL